jgi:hypothetical protein
MTAEGLLEPSSGVWQSSGMGSPTEFWTLSISDFPNDASVSLLSDIVETGDHLLPFFLSEAQCQGVLNRAERRGKVLPSAFLTRLHRASQSRSELSQPLVDGDAT